MKRAVWVIALWVSVLAAGARDLGSMMVFKISPCVGGWQVDYGSDYNFPFMGGSEHPVALDTDGTVVALANNKQPAREQIERDFEARLPIRILPAEKKGDYVILLFGGRIRLDAERSSDDEWLLWERGAHASIVDSHRWGSVSRLEERGGDGQKKWYLSVNIDPDLLQR